MSRTRPIVLGSGLLLLVLAAALPLLRRGGYPVAADSSPAALPVVEVARAESREMRRTVRLGGTLRSGSEATLSPKQGGRVTGVYVHEGQSVRRGQVLVTLDNADARRQAEQAAAGVAAARANWEKALEGVRLKRLDVERRIADARQAVELAQLQVAKVEAGIRLQARAAQADVARAQAGVDAARSALAQAKRGARPEQKRQAEILLRQAERAVGPARKNLEDLELLYAKGGAARLQVEEAREAHRKALDGVAQARAQLDLLEKGATPDEVASAEAQLHSAEAALAAAKNAAAREELDRADLAATRGALRQAEAGLAAAIAARAEILLAERDEGAARAAHAQALAASRLAAQQLPFHALASPVDGSASTVNADVGELAGPGQPLVTVVSSGAVYLEAAAPARHLNGLAPGLPAVVTAEALPGRSFRGVVRSVARVAGPDGRSYPIQIDVDAPAGLLRPAGFARATVTVETFPDAVTVPLEALQNESGRTFVWVVRSGRAFRERVAVPLQDERRVMVRGDIRTGDTVVLAGTVSLRSGAEVSTATLDRAAGARP